MTQLQRIGVLRCSASVAHTADVKVTVAQLVLAMRGVDGADIGTLTRMLETTVKQAVQGLFVREPITDPTDTALPDLEVTEEDVARMLRGSMQIMLIARHLARMLVGDEASDQRALIKLIDEQLVAKQKGAGNARSV